MSVNLHGCCESCPVHAGPLTSGVMAGLFSPSLGHEAVAGTCDPCSVVQALDIQTHGSPLPQWSGWNIGSLGEHPADLGGAIIHLNCPTYDRPSPGAPSDYPTEVCSTSLFQLMWIK